MRNGKWIVVKMSLWQHTNLLDNIGTLKVGFLYLFYRDDDDARNESDEEVRRIEKL